MIPKLSGCGRRFGRFIPQPPLRGNGVVVARHRSSRRSCAPGFEQWDYKLHAGYAKETQRLLLADPGGRRVLENILGRIKDRMLRARSLCGPLAMKQSLLNFDVVWSCRPPQLTRFTVANRKSGVIVRFLFFRAWSSAQKRVWSFSCSQNANVLVKSTGNL